MTRLRTLLLSFRTRRAQQLSYGYGDAMLFEAFCNESPVEKYPATKESSLTTGIKLSPVHKLQADDYVRFSAENSSRCSRPSFTTILLITMLTAVFLIFPFVYFFHFFNVIHVDNTDMYYYIKYKDRIHYAPSSKVHEELQGLMHTFKKRIKTNSSKSPLPPPPKPDYNQCRLLKDEDKFDCFPDAGANPDACEARGCCWIPKRNRKSRPATKQAPVNVPYCFYPPNYESYSYVNITQTAFGLVGFLKRNYRSPYPGDAETVKMTVKYENENRLHVKFTDPSKNRFEPPYPEVPIVDKATANTSYGFIIDGVKPGFKVVRKSDGTVIFDSSSVRNFIFSNQFLQMSARLPSKFIYGIGEHRSNLLLSMNWQQFTLFNHDGIPTENMNLYGSHPFYMLVEQSGNSHGVFLLNSNAMDIILQPAPAITFRTIGGVLDFYFFLGPTPSDVISQYTDVIGKPYMPPYWGLGFHLCRFGYNTLNETRKIMQRNIDAGIPLDTQWNDLDYMSNRNDFTYDNSSFKGLPEFVEELHSKGMHYIPLVDPGVSAGEIPGSYPPYDKGIEMDIFVKNFTGQPFVGKVWNRATTVWPDFTHPNTVDYWTLMLRSMHEQFSFDGAWIDMNEPSNFLSGSFTGCPNSSLEKPPYLPAIAGGQINYKTLCMTAKHYAGLHYDVHNLYGFTEAIVTSFAMAEIRGKRPMVISRATFPGLGRYAGHWSGDVYSKWVDMKYTIPQLLNFGMFGIPLMGADICGFNGNTTASLCNRWMQLGAFYPFSRNHNADGIDQDPAAFGPEVVASSKKALGVRYSLLPYLYTLFWLAHVQGTTVARPLFFEFIKDQKTYTIDSQFLWGPAVLITPVLEENSITVNAYFPAGIWYDYYTKLALQSKGESLNVSAPLDTIPVFVRAGYIIPQQTAANTTTESRKSKIQLLVASDEKGEANGQLYWDDGDSLNAYEEKRYTLLQFSVAKGVLRSVANWWGPETPPNLGKVTVLGINTPITEVKVNNIAQTFTYDTIHKTLTVDNLDIGFKNPVVITWK